MRQMNVFKDNTDKFKRKTSTDNNKKNKQIDSMNKKKS